MIYLTSMHCFMQYKSGIAINGKEIENTHILLIVSHTYG